MFWLKAAALPNMLYILDTDATFHLLMSALNVGLEEKSQIMFDTAAVFQPTMLPYVVVAVAGSFTHAVAAVPMLAFVMVVSACATGMKSQPRMSTAPMSRQRFTLRGNAARPCRTNAQFHRHRHRHRHTEQQTHTGTQTQTYTDTNAHRHTHKPQDTRPETQETHRHT